MANKFVGNLLIIDSAGPANSLIVGSASWPQHQAKIKSVVFWGANTTSTLELVTASDTSNVVIMLTPQTAPTPSAGTTVEINFGEGINFEELRCRTLTAGTAWVYFG